MSKTVLITGCDGYIGAHVVLACIDQGYEIHGLDLRTNPQFNDVERYMRYHQIGDVTSKEDVSLFTSRHYDAVIHLAGRISVEESVRDPSLYYKTNTYGTHLLASRLSYDNFIYASTAAAFSMSNPYGVSKAAGEDLVNQAVKGTGRDRTIFRFFNVAGSGGEYGQVCPPSHIIKIAAEVAAGKREHFVLNGIDFDTKDGSCVRDYIHVQDLAEAIVSAVEKPSKEPFECLSSLTPYSNLQVIHTMMEVTGERFDYTYGPRRAGDPATLVAPKGSPYIDGKKLKSLEDMCLSAYQMEMKK